MVFSFMEPPPPLNYINSSEINSLKNEVLQYIILHYNGWKYQQESTPWVKNQGGVDFLRKYFDALLKRFFTPFLKYPPS